MIQMRMTYDKLNNLKIEINHPSEEILISGSDPSLIVPSSTPNIVINEKDNSSNKSTSSLAPPSRPSLNRSTTLPNISLASEDKEPKFLPVPKSNRFTPSPPASPTSPNSLSKSSLNITPSNELRKSESANSLSNNLGPKVLVVEDNAVNRMILSTFLKKRGIRFEEAENGAIGVEKFRKALEDDGGFDVVLMGKLY
jgi:CheY-like chemotaxis protein